MRERQRQRERKIKKVREISEKLTTDVSHLDEKYNKKTLDKIISISKDVKHPLHHFVIN